MITYRAIAQGAILNSHHGPLTRYVKLRIARAPGMPRTFSLPPRVSDPDMHHGTCVTHVPWCMPGSLTRVSFEVGGGENVPGITGACAIRNFTYLVRGPYMMFKNLPGIVGNHGVIHYYYRPAFFLRSADFSNYPKAAWRICVDHIQVLGFLMIRRRAWSSFDVIVFNRCPSRPWVKLLLLKNTVA